MCQICVAPAPPGTPQQSVNTIKGDEMEIPKEQILDLLRQRGDNDKAEQAKNELPDQVDTERDSGILDRLGIDPKDLLGGLGGAAGKLGL
jgi:hypothetical protein